MRTREREPKGPGIDVLGPLVLAAVRAPGGPHPTPRVVEAVSGHLILAGSGLGLHPRARVWNVLRRLEAEGKVRKAARSARTGTTWEACDAS